MTGFVEIPEKGKPNVIQCSFCDHKMIIYGFGNNTGAYVEPVKNQYKLNRLILYFGTEETVSNNFTFEVVDTLNNCYPE
jgi:hypothetical protein